jgi:hypothetical protein
MILDTSIRIGLTRGVLSAFLILAGALSSMYAQQPADSSSTTPSPKPKKVWSNDDLTPGDSAGTAATVKPTAPTHPVKATTPQPANRLRTRLEKVKGAMERLGRATDRLKRFASGDTSGDAGRQLHKGYNMEPIPDQIAKLEEKMHQLQLQIDAIYDEARKKGIPAGDLR